LHGVILARTCADAVQVHHAGALRSKCGHACTAMKRCCLPAGLSFIQIDPGNLF